jgi:NAD(P)H-dependent FMN reductase
MDFLVFLGSVRESTPPRPARLGLRVARACVSHIAGAGHAATLIDPLDFDLGGVFKPQFAYARGKAPRALEALAERIAKADGHVMVSPEYNHSMSPALAHLLNHFGALLFAFKPSLIVTYPAGQWSGARAAIGMRAFLSELGCLPVSAMVHVPRRRRCSTLRAVGPRARTRRRGRVISGAAPPNSCGGPGPAPPSARWTGPGPEPSPGIPPSATRRKLR